jgi:hypothetical protein
LIVSGTGCGIFRNPFFLGGPLQTPLRRTAGKNGYFRVGEHGNIRHAIQKKTQARTTVVVQRLIVKKISPSCEN